MYIPSSFLFDMIRSEQIGIFCESNTQGDKAIVAKLPTSTIKAIALGVKVEFYVFTTSKAPHYLALCMKIYDNQSSPMHAVLAQRWQNPNNLLDFSFFNSDLDLTLFDETDAAVQEGKIRIKTNFKNKRISNVLQNTPFTSSNDYIAVNNFTDSVCADLGLGFDAHPQHPILSFKFSVKITGTHSVKAIHVNEQASTHYNVMEDIDGTRQERQVYQSLCLMSNSATAISPLVTIGKKERELTDILTITQNHQLIAIESKCLQVDKDAANKDQERTAASIIKHCKKALGQLEGAFKTVQKGERVYDDHGKALLSDDEYSFYGVVLIDEYRPSKDWDEVISLMLSLSNTHKICLNIVSISELIYTMKLCNSNTSLFVEALENRHRVCKETNSIDIHFINSSLPTMVD